MGLRKSSMWTALRAVLAGAGLLGAVSVLAQNTELVGSGVKDALETVVAEVAEGAAAGRELLGELDRPTQEVLERMSSGTDFEYVGFSARTQVEALYNLAEAGEENGGSRLLAKLHRRLGGESAILQLDQGLQAISSRFTPAALGRDMVYADPRTTARSGGLLKPLPENIAKAVDLLAGAMAPHEFGVVTGLAERHLKLGQADGRRPRRVVNQVIMAAGSRRNVLDQLIRAHGPPPPVQDALRALVRDVASRSAVFAMDESVGTVLRGLGEEPLPPRMEAYERLGDQLPSRAAQQVASQGRGRVAAAPDLAGEVVDRGARAVDNAAGGPSGGGGGPSYEESRRRHATYGSRIHATTGGVPRNYHVAVRSSRAARGVAVGADVRGPRVEPERAFWIPGRGGGFGRLVVKVRGEDRLAATRYLFVDSFEASVSMLWGDHDETAALNKGEVVILMSMDPESEIGKARREDVYARASARFEELRDELERAPSDHDPLAVLAFLVQAENVEAEVVEELAEIPRGIVIHPAAYGRELAWSAARVDFWFNDLDAVSREGAMLNGGEAMPASLREAWTGTAGTWQFYELDAELSIIESEGLADNLVVRSRTGPSGFGEGRRFSVSLFSFDAESPGASAERNEDEGTWRLDGEEVALQPMLDWVFSNHHDFMRLNDFSESLSVLRWLQDSGCEILMIDSVASNPVEMTTPDRVFLGEVLPHAGPVR